MVAGNVKVVGRCIDGKLCADIPMQICGNTQTRERGRRCLPKDRLPNGCSHSGDAGSFNGGSIHKEAFACSSSMNTGSNVTRPQIANSVPTAVHSFLRQRQRINRGAFVLASMQRTVARMRKSDRHCHSNTNLLVGNKN